MFNIKTYFNFGYTVSDLLKFNYNLVPKDERVKLRRSLHDSLPYAHGDVKDKIYEVISMLIDVGMNNKQ